MILSPPWRKLALTVHVIASVGWLGAVIAYLGLSVVAVTGDDAATVRAVHLAMDAGGWAVLVPSASPRCSAGSSSRSAPRGVCWSTTGWW